MIRPLLLVIVAATFAFGQKNTQITEKLIYEFDPARLVEHFDASPNGSLWFAVDGFAQEKNIIISGKRIDRPFNEIPVASAQMDPSGSYVIWMGLVRNLDLDGFNMTTTEVYKAYPASTGVRNDSIGFFTSDYNALAFSRDGAHWAAMLPRANVKQTGLRDVVLLDGKILSTDRQQPRMFSFGNSGDAWSFRASDDTREYIVTKDGEQVLSMHNKNPYARPDEAVIRFFSADNIALGGIVEGFDYNHNFTNAAALYKTSYRSAHKDSARFYLIFKNKVQRPLRWVNNISIDTSGEHIAYFGADPAWVPMADERKGVVVYDGNVIAGPYASTSLLFMSPSGKHLAWTVKESDGIKLYYDKKDIASVGSGMKVVWSRDEKQFAYVTSNERGKSVVHVAGKESAPFDRTGRLDFAADCKAVEFVGLRANKLYQVKMKL
jgi:hypothetical protein